MLLIRDQCLSFIDVRFMCRYTLHSISNCFYFVFWTLLLCNMAVIHSLVGLWYIDKSDLYFNSICKKRKTERKKLIQMSPGGAHLIPLTRIGCGVQGWISLGSNHSLTVYVLFCSFYFTQQKTCHRRPVRSVISEVCLLIFVKLYSC